MQEEGITLPWCDALSLIVGALIILYIIVVIVYFARFKCQCDTQEISTENPLQDINLVIIAEGGGEEEGGGGGEEEGEGEGGGATNLRKKDKKKEKNALDLRADRQGCWLTSFDATLRLTLLRALSLCY